MIRENTGIIYNKNYINGSFLRKELKGHFQYYRYNYAALSVDKAKGNFIIKDSINDFLFSNKMISKKKYDDFYKHLKNYFSSFLELENLSDEEIYGEVHNMRQDFYNETTLAGLRNLREEKLKKYYNKSKKNDDIDSLLRESIYYDIKNSNRMKKSKIDKLKRLKYDLLNSGKDVIFLAEHYIQLPFLLKLISKYLLNTKKNVKTEVYLLLKDVSMVEEPNQADFEYLINLSNDKNLKNLIKNDNFNILLYNNCSAGIDLSSLNSVLEKLFLQAVKGNKLVVGLGEKMIFSLDQSNFDYYILASIKSIRAQRYTNLYHDSSLKIPFVVSRVAAREVAGSKFSGVELIDKTLYHYNYLYDKHGEHNDININKICPKIRVNFYSTSFLDYDFPEFEIEKGNDLFEIEEKKQSKYKEIIEKNNDVVYQSSCYNLRNLTQLNSIQNLKNTEEPLFFNNILFNDLKEIELSPFSAEDTKKGIVSPRELVEKSRYFNNYSFYHNFLYFVTDKLIADYNQLRKKYPLEKVDLNNIFLGYYLQNGKKRKETFPLYNKGFMAYTKSGEIFFGNRKLEGGFLKINDKKISWTKEQVNPGQENKDFDFIIYTPMIENENLSSKNIDFRKYKYFVGNGRLNLLVIDNKIEVAKRGELMLPSIGIVLSFAGEIKDEIKKVLNLSNLSGDYYSLNDYEFSIELDPPTEVEDEDWNNILWAFGGGTTLVRNGKNLVKNQESQKKNFKSEGWFHPLSKQTQETQVQDWVRGPRTVIGLTRKRKFFVASFSGRTRLSCGVNFSEIITILNKEIGNLNWVMNLDGGASSCLGFIYKKHFFELNYPAVSNYTAAGMVRPVNSMVFIKSKNLSSY